MESNPFLPGNLCPRQVMNTDKESNSYNLDENGQLPFDTIQIPSPPMSFDQTAWQRYGPLGDQTANSLYPDSEHRFDMSIPMDISSNSNAQPPSQGNTMVNTEEQLWSSRSNSSNFQGLKSRSKHRGIPSPFNALTILGKSVQKNNLLSAESKKGISSLLVQVKRILENDGIRRLPLASFPYSQPDQHSQPIQTLCIMNGTSFPDNNNNGVDYAMMTPVASNSTGPSSSISYPLQSSRSNIKLDAGSGSTSANMVIYQCTYPGCVSAFQTKGEWKKHEETEKHWLQQRYMCLFCIPLPSDGDLCNFCRSKINPKNGVFDHSLRCEIAMAIAKSFGRKAALDAHLKTDHPTQARPQNTETWSFATESHWPRQCGFCGDLNDDWSLRADHVGQHFKDGYRISTWRLPFVADVHSAVTNTIGDFNDKNDDDENDYHDHKRNYTRLVPSCYIIPSTAVNPQNGSIKPYFDSNFYSTLAENLKIRLELCDNASVQKVHSKFTSINESLSPILRTHSKSSNAKCDTDPDEVDKMRSIINDQSIEPAKFSLALRQLPIRSPLEQYLLEGLDEHPWVMLHPAIKELWDPIVRGLKNKTFKEITAVACDQKKSHIDSDESVSVTETVYSHASLLSKCKSLSSETTLDSTTTKSAIKFVGDVVPEISGLSIDATETSAEDETEAEPIELLISEGSQLPDKFNSMGSVHQRPSRPYQRRAWISLD